MPAVEIEMVARCFHDGPLAGQFRWVPCRERVTIHVAGGRVDYRYRCGIDKMVQERNDG